MRLSTNLPRNLPHLARVTLLLGVSLIAATLGLPPSEAQPPNPNVALAQMKSNQTLGWSASSTAATASDVSMGRTAASKWGVGASTTVANPALLVDQSTASAVTGLQGTSNIAGSGYALSVIGGNAAENLTLDAKGAGTITLAGTSTGNVIARAVTVGPSTLTGASTTSNWLNVTGTLPTTMTSSTYGLNYQMTGAGTSAQTLVGVNAALLAGYTGASQNAVASFINSSAGTGVSNFAGNYATPQAANFGLISGVNAVTAGSNIGAYGYASNSSGNEVGGFFKADQGPVNNPVNAIGVVGGASNATSNNIGGYFSCITQNNDPIPFVNSFGTVALMSDAGSSGVTPTYCYQAVTGSVVNFSIAGTGAYYGTADAIGLVGASKTLDVTKGNTHTITSTASTNMTITPSAAGVAGQHIWIVITSDATGGVVVTFASTFKPTGTMTLTASKVHTITFVSNGTNWFETARTTGL